MINAAVTALQKNKVDNLNEVIMNTSKKDLFFKSPTGSGKTRMIGMFMDDTLSRNSDIVFFVTSLSKAGLAEQNYNRFCDMRGEGFNNLNPYLIHNESSKSARTEGNFEISTDYNVYVLPVDSYHKGTILKERGTLERFFGIMQQNRKRIWLIKDECHRETSNINELYDVFERVVNFSATLDDKKNQHPDVIMTETEAEAVNLIRHIDRNNDVKSPDKIDIVEALKIFKDKQSEYEACGLNINPCFIFQISNKNNGKDVREIAMIKEAMDEASDMASDFIWCYLSGKDSECETNSAHLQEIPPSKWKTYLADKLCEVNIVIFKMTLTEGYDIPRACTLYQIRDTASDLLTEQVVGRVRRNPMLTEFDSLSTEAKELVMSCTVYGAIEEKSLPYNVKLKHGHEHKIGVQTTYLSSQPSSVGFDVKDFLDNTDADTDAVHTGNFFDLYNEYKNIDEMLQVGCTAYMHNTDDIFHVLNHSNEIQTAYTKSIDVGGLQLDTRTVYFPCEVFIGDTEDTGRIDNWVWERDSSTKKNQFPFDSQSEKLFADFLSKCVGNKNNGRVGEFGEYPWGKNFLDGSSEICYGYYNNGIHKSYPDFIMKDKSQRIHIFEVKGETEKANVAFDVNAYLLKINRLIEGYKAASKLLFDNGYDYIFYVPVFKGNNGWDVTICEQGKIFKHQTLNDIKNRIQ